MLKGISPLLTPEILAGLARMGHGDHLAIVDCNYPAHRAANVVEMPGVTTEQMLEAVLSVFPVDTFETAPWSVRHMLTDGSEESPATPRLREMWRAACDGEPKEVGMNRMDFYGPASEAMLTIHTGETIPYACYMIAKGVC